MWRKLVTLDPIGGITFELDPYEQKPMAAITLKNMSEQPLLFKVKTTSPNNYLVRPNQGICR